MSGSEMIGDLAQSALTARAVEPAHGEQSDGHSHESACLNCGTVLIGSHCHMCGQAAHVHKTLGAFFHDLLHGVIHFEGKIWRTLPKLAFKPGQLTREYVDGRRASYVSPIALFLFSVFLMFAVVKQVAGEFGSQSNIDVNGVAIKGLAENEQAIKDLKARRAELVKAGKPTDPIDGEIAGRETAVESIKKMRGEFGADDLAKVKDAKFTSDVPAIQHALDQFKDNPALVIYKLQNNAYKYSWALIPISVPFVWLLFLFRRRFYLYDHTVFVTYSLCFMTLLVVVVVLGNALGADFLAFLLLLAPLHMYKQLRGTYALTRFEALWRTGALLAIATTALILFTMLILAETGG